MNIMCSLGLLIDSGWISRGEHGISTDKVWRFPVNFWLKQFQGGFKPCVFSIILEICGWLSIIFEHVPSFSQHIWDDPNFHILQASKTASDPVTSSLRMRKWAWQHFHRDYCFFKKLKLVLCWPWGQWRHVMSFPISIVLQMFITTLSPMTQKQRWQRGIHRCHLPTGRYDDTKY